MSTCGYRRGQPAPPTRRTRRRQEKGRDDDSWGIACHGGVSKSMNWEGAFATTLPEDAHKNGEVRSIVRLSCEARDHGPSAHSSIPPMNTDVVDGGVLMNVGWRDRKRWTVRWRSKDEPYRGERAFKRKRGFVRKPGTVLVHHGAVPPYRTRSYALGSPRSRPRERMSLKTQILGW